MKGLDRLESFLYKARLSLVAALVAATASFGTGKASATEAVLGVPMPKKSVPDGAFRFVHPSASLRDVVKFFKKKLKRSSHTFIDALDHPKAKVVHIRSGDASTAWEGINLSLYNRRVYIQVLPRSGIPKAQRRDNATENEAEAP